MYEEPRGQMVGMTKAQALNRAEVSTTVTNCQIDTIMDLTNLITSKLQSVMSQSLPQSSEKNSPRTELEEKLSIVISRLEDLSDRICL